MCQSNNDVNFSENTMSEQEDFILGKDYIHRASNILHKYNPDKMHNFHISISGSSGSGKTRTLKSLIKYLKNKNKHIHVIDIKGDLHIDGENYIDFPIRNQKYGINPFEFDKNIETGGVKRRSGEIVEMIIKSFKLNIGAAKKDIISRLIQDTYLVNGITEDESTWGMNLSKQEQANMLPSIEDLNKLTNAILDAVSYGHSDKLNKHLVKYGKEAVNSSTKLSKINTTFKKLQIRLEEKYTDAALKEAENSENSFNEILQKLVKEDESFSSIKSLKESIKEEEKNIEECKKAFLESVSIMFENYIDNEGKENSSNFESFVTEDDIFKNIDLKYYSKKNVVAMLESISVYFGMLSNSGLFNKTVPPVKAGLNRYDISKHNQETQIFFTEVIAFKLFNATKLRGDYGRLTSSYKEKRGLKNDTFLVIDEAQVILPDTKAKDRESSSQIINRIAAESRSYGMGIILSSQSMSKFSNVININIPNKIILKTLGVDINITKKLINLTDKKDKTFDIINTSFGIGLYIDETQKKNIFMSPWYDDSSSKKKLD